MIWKVSVFSLGPNKELMALSLSTAALMVSEPVPERLGGLGFLIDVLYVYECSVFVHTRRGHQIALQTIVSHRVDAGN